MTYTSFDELNDFEDSHTFKQDLKQYLTQDIVIKMSDPEEWNEQFEAINQLRVMNKFHYDVLMKNLISFSKFIKDSVDNLRSGISKNALMFTTEFFGN